MFITIGVTVLALVILGRLFAGFYVDYLWHQSVDRTDVFWGVLVTKLVLFAAFTAVFAALAIINLLIADRLAPTAFTANTHPVVERFHDVFGRRTRVLRIGIAVLLALLVAAPAVGRWQDWTMFQHSRSFGIADPQFGHDVGFYLFRLPFITFVVDWLYAALIIVLLLTLAAHILNGGIVFAPPRPRVRAATKAHLAILLAVLALVKAADYWVTRFELTSVVRGIVRGPTYSVVNAQLPAVVLLALIAVLVAGLYLSTLKTGSWRLPLIGSALWVVMAIVGGIIYPAVIQALVVNPNQSEREQPYIERNVLATRAALGIDDVESVPVDFGVITEPALSQQTEPLTNVRLLNPVVMLERFRSDVGDSAGLTINDLDPDRYDFDGRVQQMIVGARELDLDTIPNKSWQGRHLISTHGCGVVLSPAGQVEQSGRPVFQEAELDRRELYFSDQISGYAVVGTDVREIGCPGAGENTYEGSGGIRIGSGFRRLMFAVDNLDYNLIGSSAINADSRFLMVRSVGDRVQRLAPFLTFDNDPYPVTLDGRVLWVIDAYTTSNRYPYGESADRRQLIPGSGLDQPLNYVRNSVKAVVDAYTGDASFYVMDDVDPVLRVWRAAFPDMFEPLSAMPAGLVDHLRYPEELFRLQTAAYSKYRLDPKDFFDRDRAWSVAQAPADQIQPQAISGATPTAPDQTSRQQQDFQGDGAAARFIPYYSMFTPPGSTTSSFELFRPFVPFSTDDRRRELQAFMTASSDPATYGRLVSYELTSPLPDGPGLVSDTMSSEPTVSREITLLNQQGSEVLLGDLQMIPIADGTIWFRPLYVAPQASTRVQFRYLIASYRGKAAIGTSLGDVLGKLFAGFDDDLGDVVGGGGTPAEPSEPVDPNEPTVEATPEELLQQADALFAEAEDELRRTGDLGAYQSKIDEATALVRQALDGLTGG